MAFAGMATATPMGMIHQSYSRSNNQGINDMLTAFSTNIVGALATKYGVTPEQITRVSQAQKVWDWFEHALVIARGWSSSLTATRQVLSSGAPGETDPMPALPVLPPVPTLPGTPPTPVVLEHDFFNFFSGLVSGIKKSQHYDPADGKLLGIEGTPVPKPDPSVTPSASVGLSTGGHPTVVCPKGQFQGFDVYATLPGGTRQFLATSLGRKYDVGLPLPAAGTAQIWVFEVQYRYQNQPFGLMSQPVSVTVRG